MESVIKTISALTVLRVISMIWQTPLANTERNRNSRTEFGVDEIQVLIIPESLKPSSMQGNSEGCYIAAGNISPLEMSSHHEGFSSLCILGTFEAIHHVRIPRFPGEIESPQKA